MSIHGDEEEDRYSAQQRGARPHDQYDKADRGALERTGAGDREVENNLDERHESHQARRSGGDRWRSTFALVLKCYVRRCGTD